MLRLLLLINYREIQLSVAVDSVATIALGSEPTS
jgi:hypothetical protein